MRPSLAKSTLLFALTVAACAASNSNGLDPNDANISDPDCLPADPRARSFYLDADGDGWGLSTQSVFTCQQPDGYVEQHGDCNDADDTVYPGAPDDQCNGIDNNCDGRPDSDAREVLRYRDNDDDGWGNDSQTGLGCLPSPGWVDVGGDCDDDDPAVYPGAIELCDGKDTNCNGIENDGLWGSGELCPADSCKTILRRLPLSQSGTYWLEDEAGSYRAECRMDAGAGWTRISSNLIRVREWSEFLVYTPTAAHDLVTRWDGDVIEIIPRRLSSYTDCTTVPVRIFIGLPFEFDHTEGSLLAGGRMNDTDYTRAGSPFSGGSPPCRGAVGFRTRDYVEFKAGGEWGFNFDASGLIAWPRTSLPRTDHGFTLEFNDFNNGSTHRAELRVRSIDIWVH